MTHWFRIGILAFVLGWGSPVRAQSAGKPASPTDHSWGWLVVFASIATGAAITTYGLSIDCEPEDHDCHRRASLPIWGGVGVAAAGSLIGIWIVDSPAGPNGTALTLRGSFD